MSYAATQFAPTPFRSTRVAPARSLDRASLRPVQVTATYSVDGGVARVEEALVNPRQSVADVIRWAKDVEARLAAKRLDVELSRIELTVS